MLRGNSQLFHCLSTWSAQAKAFNTDSPAFRANVSVPTSRLTRLKTDAPTARTGQDLLLVGKGLAFKTFKNKER